jgi:putative nucleotidyltransferase with HDIG domain
MMNLPRYHVGSGSYYVGETKPLILEASLGTCVGVAICDHQNGIGGLSHLLLSEPRSLQGSFEPEKYASTGLPIFLNSLLAAGACRDNLKASIAGGALVGPLEHNDLTLDIGGQTTERTMQFLDENGIRVDKSETGGFMTSVLNLNMKTWESYVAPMGNDRQTASEPVSNLTHKKIDHAATILQPIPQVALKILRIIAEDTYDIRALTEEIRRDQVLSAQTLRLCNSVYFGNLTKIESLDHALVYLGQKLMIKFVISASIHNFFDQAGMGYSLCKGGMYHHAVGTAIIAERLARLTGQAQPALAYTAGLLHDIGKVVLDQYVQPAFPFFYRQMQEKNKDFIEIEANILGMDHTQVGRKLAKQWSFPVSLVETIAHHHRPEDSMQHSELVHIVYLADLLMSRFHTGLEIDRLDTGAIDSRLAHIGLSRSDFADIVDVIPIKVLKTSPDAALSLEAEDG